jgi:hypothetical protein
MAHWLLRFLACGAAFWALTSPARANSIGPETAAAQPGLPAVFSGKVENGPLLWRLLAPWTGYLPDSTSANNASGPAGPFEGAASGAADRTGSEESRAGGFLARVVDVTYLLAGIAWTAGKAPAGAGTPSQKTPAASHFMLFTQQVMAWSEDGAGYLHPSSLLLPRPRASGLFRPPRASTVRLAS